MAERTEMNCSAHSYSKVFQLLQPLYQVQIRQGPVISIHAGFAVRRNQYRPDGFNAGGIRGHELLPCCALASRDLEDRHLGGNLARSIYVDRAPIRGEV